MRVRSLTLALGVSLSVALGGLIACGEVDSLAADWCEYDDHCVCDPARENCCITEEGHCFEGQCCDGLVCGPSGRCVPGS